MSWFCFEFGILILICRTYYLFFLIFSFYPYMSHLFNPIITIPNTKLPSLTLTLTLTLITTITLYLHLIFSSSSFRIVILICRTYYLSFIILCFLKNSKLSHLFNLYIIANIKRGWRDFLHSTVLLSRGVLRFNSAAVFDTASASVSKRKL